MMPLPGWPAMAPNAYDNNNNTRLSAADSNYKIIHVIWQMS